MFFILVYYIVKKFFNPKNKKFKVLQIKKTYVTINLQTSEEKMNLKSENEYFEIIDNLITTRTQRLYAHFGKNFLEAYTDPDERDWYNQNIAPFDATILKNINELCKVLGIKKTFKKIAEVFQDSTISNWYNARKIEKNKKQGNSRP